MAWAPSHTPCAHGCGSVCFRARPPGAVSPAAGPTVGPAGGGGRPLGAAVHTTAQGQRSSRDFLELPEYYVLVPQMRMPSTPWSRRSPSNGGKANGRKGAGSPAEGTSAPCLPQHQQRGTRARRVMNTAAVGKLETGPVGRARGVLRGSAKAGTPGGQTCWGQAWAGVTPADSVPGRLQGGGSFGVAVARGRGQRSRTKSPENLPGTKHGAGAAARRAGRPPVGHASPSQEARERCQFPGAQAP